MAVPCVTDTCSITGTIDSNRRLALSARLDPTGGLVCGTDADENAGLRVAIYDDPGTSGSLLDACLNGLRRTTAGELLAVSPRAGIRVESGEVVEIPHNASESNSSVDFPVTNPYDCSVLGVGFGRMELTYEVASTGPFNADIRGRVLRNGTGFSAVFFDVGGDAVDGDVAGSVKRRYAYYIDVFTAGAGATDTWTATANHENADERKNMNTVGTAGGTDLGFRALTKVLYLPFNSTAVA